MLSKFILGSHFILIFQVSEGNQKHTNLQKSIEKAKIGRHETVSLSLESLIEEYSK